MPRRVALYCRYSDQKQARRGGVSPASQLKNLREAAHENGEIIVAELIDQAKTGTEMTRRKEYLQLIELARTEQIDLVRLEDVSRGSRNEFDRLYMERELTNYNVELLYLGEDPNASPEQRMIWRGIKGNLAQFESHQTSQRVYKRTRYRAEQGRWRGGSIPYGLKSDNRGWFIPDPETYPYLLYILEHRADGWGYRRITSELNKGISVNGRHVVIPPTPGTLEYQRWPFIERIDPESGNIFYIDKPEPSPAWNVATVRRICIQAVDGIYAGVLNWGHSYAKLACDDQNRPKTPIRFVHDQPLVPAELIEGVRAVEAGVPDRQRFKGRPSSFLLKPTCACCSGPMRGWSHIVGYNGKDGKVKYQYRYYVCVHAEGSGGTRCVVAPVDADYVDQEVIRQVCEFAQTINRDEYIREFEAGLKRRTAELRRQVDDLEEQIAAAEHDKNRVTGALKEFRELLKYISAKELTDQVNEAVERLGELKAERDKTTALLKGFHEWVHRPDFNSLDFFCKMPDLSIAQQRETVQWLINALVAEIRVMTGERKPRQRTRVNAVVEVIFKEPAEFLENGNER